MKPLTVVCCSVLRREMGRILEEDLPGAEAVFLDSMLHMHPEELRRAIDAVLAARTDRRILLVYGDCHARMAETCRQPRRARTAAVNCGELLLGRERYRECRNGRAFLFLPEWTQRWREVFVRELGFTDRSLAREFMQENQRRLAYLDTGLIPVPEPVLAEIADYFGMPVEIVAVTLVNLRQAVRDAARRLEAEGEDGD
ncbi:MAG: DUF1638 domain-containing protein [Desulfobulbaceae bacterium]|nr:MAG: DUF1638 domain-containing protein [Desulfobulbaceae bacterium]